MDESNPQIGGNGKAVKIEESKFGKRKNHKGSIIDGQWVFGGICKEDSEVFLVTVPSHDKDTLLPIILERIRPETTIISDCWKSYDCLSEEDLLHLKVNHSLNFVDPDTGCLTQNIENLWWGIKRRLLNTYVQHNQLYLHLAEYLWRNMRCKSHNLFAEFMRDATKYTYFTYDSENSVFVDVSECLYGPTYPLKY